MLIFRAASSVLLAATVLCAQDAPSKDAPPKPKSEFEVASIRPSGAVNPGTLNIGLHIDGAQVRATYLSLNDYIGMAYKVKNYQISGPDWLASDRFDIAAKLPEGADRSQVADMIKHLLEERFHMSLHKESRPFPVYALVVAKTGLKIKPVEVDPNAPPLGSDLNVSASGSKGGVTVSYGKDSYFTLGDDKFIAKHLPMVAIADTLARFVDKPVVDMTETKGVFDFALEFTPDDFRGMMIRSAIAAGVQLPPQALQALQGTSDASLHTALHNIGLSLDSRKAPIDVLVIDKIEKLPTEN